MTNARQILLDQLKNREEADLVVRPVKGKGVGVFPLRPFQKGEYLAFYDAEVITEEEGIRREETYGSAKACFMYFAKFDGKIIW